VVILAEGGSPRLRPLTEHLPTTLLPVGGVPILDHQIQDLLKQGLSEITVVGGYRAAQVEQACRIYPGIRFRINPDFSRAEPRLGSLRGEHPGNSDMVLLRGDLLVDRGLLAALVEHPHLDVSLVDGKGRPIGLTRISSALFAQVVEHGKRPGDGGMELFPWLGAFLAERGGQVLPAGDSWVIVGTMEDLARSLLAHREGEPRPRVPLVFGPSEGGSPTTSSGAPATHAGSPGDRLPARVSVFLRPLLRGR
jgi:CTP:molybdopterin cytidylyltransferase MocA